MIKWCAGIKITVLLMIVAFCLFSFVLEQRNEVFREFEDNLFQTQSMVLMCLGVWSVSLSLLKFKFYDFPLLALLLIAITVYFVDNAQPEPAALTLLSGVTLGKAALTLLPQNQRSSGSGVIGRIAEMDLVLVGLVALLAVAPLWRVEMPGDFYHGPRWIGPWRNPNEYGMLVAAGLAVAVGLLAGMRNVRRRDQASLIKTMHCFAFFTAPKSGIDNCKGMILFIALAMMGTGLVCSYSRGAWVGMAVGLLYLVKIYGKFKWSWVLPPICVVAVVIWFFWNATSDTAPWYLARLDFGRGSVQHRLAAWKAGFEIMRDHPFGVGWNKALGTYEMHYSPPQNGAGAITTNDYLMLGTQLGWPGLGCFVAYVGLALRGRPGGRGRRPEVGDRGADGHEVGGSRITDGGMVRCPPSPKSSPQGLVFSRRPSSGLLPPSPVPAGAGFLGRGLSCALRFWNWLRLGLAGGHKSEIKNQKSEISEEERLQAACRAGAVALAVAFWFDGGLFVLPTAAVFWILLELGQVRRARNDA